MNLVGRKFGKLTVLELVVPKPYSKKTYLCKCDCEKMCTRLESTLKRAKRDNRISSCGCYLRKYLKPGTSDLCSKAGKHRKDSFVDACNVQMTFREGTIKTNTSGCQGVAWSKSAKKWHCYIGYKSYRANLGFFEDLQDAIKIRKLAEDAIREGTFEDLFYQLRGYHIEEVTKKLFKKGKHCNE